MRAIFVRTLLHKLGPRETDRGSGLSFLVSAEFSPATQYLQEPQLISKILVAIAYVLVVAGAVACSPGANLPAPTPPPFTLPTLVPFTPIQPAATRVPAITPTAVPPTATTVPTARPIDTAAPATRAVPTPTPAPSTATPTRAPSPTATIQAGLYIADLRIDPPPVRGLDLRFLATFINSAGRAQNYRWEVFIYKADTPNRIFGETARTDSLIPTGTAEQLSSGSWKLPLGGPCDYFFAQVGWLDNDNKVTFFTAPSGQIFQKGFTVCPP